MIVNPHDVTRTCVFDAWHRMVAVKSSGTIIESHAHDGRGPCHHPTNRISPASR